MTNHLRKFEELDFFSRPNNHSGYLQRAAQVKKILILAEGLSTRCAVKLQTPHKVKMTATLLTPTRGMFFNYSEHLAGNSRLKILKGNGMAVNHFYS